MRLQFIDIFHARSGGGFSVYDRALEYVKKCCVERNDAIALLKKNGFKIKIINDPDEVAKLNKRLEKSKRNWPIEEQVYFDEFIIGNRGTGILRFWMFNTSYHASFRMKKGKVVRVYAKVDTDYL